MTIFTIAFSPSSINLFLMETGYSLGRERKGDYPWQAKQSPGVVSGEASRDWGQTTRSPLSSLLREIRMQ
jgi:hypothetical protein